MAIAPRAFALDAEDKSIVLESAEEEAIEVLIDAAKACPTASITILDETGKKLYPA